MQRRLKLWLTLSRRQLLPAERLPPRLAPLLRRLLRLQEGRGRCFPYARGRHQVRNRAHWARHYRHHSLGGWPYLVLHEDRDRPEDLGEGLDGDQECRRG